jgi:heme/copper-type cytochrome/quinol oxidase subunit 4
MVFSYGLIRHVRHLLTVNQPVLFVLSLALTVIAFVCWADCGDHLRD